MRRTGAALLAAAVAALAGPAPAADAPAARPEARKERVALERLRAEGVAPALVEIVEERICAALAGIGGVEAVCPADVAAASQLAHQAALLGECASDDCMSRVDAVRRAARRVTGALVRGEGGLVLSLQLAGPSGAGPRFVERLPEDLEALVSRIPAVVKKLFP